MRGFQISEFQNRLKRAQLLMADKKLDALFLTSETDDRYFTGYLTRFWKAQPVPGIF